MSQTVEQRGFPHLPSSHQGNYFASTKVIFNQLLNCSVYHNAVVLRCKYTNFFEYNRQIYTNFLGYIRQIYTDFGGLYAILSNSHGSVDGSSREHRTVAGREGVGGGHKSCTPNEDVIKGCPIRTPLDCLRSNIALRNSSAGGPATRLLFLGGGKASLVLCSS